MASNEKIGHSNSEFLIIFDSTRQRSGYARHFKIIFAGLAIGYRYELSQPTTDKKNLSLLKEYRPLVFHLSRHEKLAAM
jgi:hypothetical protein